MQRKSMTMLALAASLALGACGGGGDDKEEEGVFDPMVESIDKAEAVEEQVLQQKDKIDQALKDAEDAEDDGGA